MAEPTKRYRGLKMFVWENVLRDYSGMVCALAHNVTEARKMALEDIYGWEGDPGPLAAEPEVVTVPKAFHVYGGG